MTPLESPPPSPDPGLGIEAPGSVARSVSDTKPRRIVLKYHDEEP